MRRRLAGSVAPSMYCNSCSLCNLGTLSSIEIGCGLVLGFDGGRNGKLWRINKGSFLLRLVKLDTNRKIQYK